MADYTELVDSLRHCALLLNGEAYLDVIKAADAIEELSRVAEAIPHVCEYCIGCEVELGGCDNAFILSPKRAKEYLSKPRWIPAKERLPEAYKPAVYCTINNDVKLGVYIPKAQAWTQTEVFAWVRGDAVTHWIPIPEPLPEPLPEPPEEET